jgi:hypothetical protein
MLKNAVVVFEGNSASEVWAAVFIGHAANHAVKAC